MLSSVQYMNICKAFFVAHAEAENALPMKQYMRNQFEFLGIKAPSRSILTKQFLKEYGLPENEQFQAVVKGLWELPEREYQYIALSLLEKKKKKLQAEDLPLLEYLVVTKSWWDTVDYIAPHLIGIIFLNNPDEINASIQKWLSSDNIWLKRCAILFQLKYKQKTNAELLFHCIIDCMESKEFFIQKAIGWALREYSKTNPLAVSKFVDRHPLAPLSKREALKIVNKTT